jgi:hypothetical protein
VAARILDAGCWHGRCTWKAAMKATNELAMDGNENDFFERWFEQGELEVVPETPVHVVGVNRRAGVGVAIAAVSATALTLVMLLARHV